MISNVLLNVRQKFVLDLIVWGIAGVLAYGLRLPHFISDNLWAHALPYLFLHVAVMGGVELHYALHHQSWPQVNAGDLRLLARAAVLATLVMVGLGYFLQGALVLPRSVPLLAGLLGFVLMAGLRLGCRLYQEHSLSARPAPSHRVLVVGAGEAGRMMVREMQRHPEAGLLPIGFLDDDPSKARQRIQGLPVLGRVEQLPEVAQRERVQEVLIAVPSASGEFIRRVVHLAQHARLSYRILPGVFELLAGQVTLQQLREVNVEDLLRRPPVQLHNEEIAGYLRGRVVLITGAGGSIGSEIVRQVARFSPGTILLFGRGENSIFSIQQELSQTWPEIQQYALIGDVRNEERLRYVFERYRPEVVFHAAAHKHVPLMEEAPSEAILNNVIATQLLVSLCLEYRVSRLVNVSTDKAINPTSVMGASKRAAEMAVAVGAARARPGQAFVSVRFGNVLGSRGSVVPTFMAQIRAGGPVTVTHPDMRRYFMTIPEAARLVLQAGGLAENGKVYLLNMGEPVRIADLARDLIRLSGANVDVVYSGIRPGEKLYEELLTPVEAADSTTHADIFSTRLAAVDPDEFGRRVAALEAYARKNDHAAIRQALHELIPENKFGKTR